MPKEEYLNKWIEDLKGIVKDNIIEKLKNGNYPRFVFQTEINSVFQRQKDAEWKFTIKIETEKSWKNIKKSRIHNVILVDWFKNAKIILDYLSKFGKVESDWRLAVRQDQADTLNWLKQNIPSSIFFPAHIWTPYFWVLWSKFGFSSLKEAFLDSYFLIDWVETWLSSDPIMNWVNKEIDPFVIVSNSDAHSLENLAREGNFIGIEGLQKMDSEDSQKISIQELLVKKFTYKDLERIFKYRKYKYFYDKLIDFERKYLDKFVLQKKQ